MEICHAALTTVLAHLKVAPPGGAARGRAAG